MDKGSAPNFTDALLVIGMPSFNKLSHYILPKYLFFLCFFTSPTYPQPQVKIATVDLLRVFDNYWKTKLSNNQLKDLRADFDKARGSMIEELNLLEENYTKLNASSQDPVNSDETRSRDFKKAQEKLIEYERLEQQIIESNNNAQKTLADQTQRLRKGRLEEIQKVISAKTKELGYDLAVDSSQDVLLPRSPTVLYTNLKNDITEIVLAELNSDAPQNPELITPNEPSLTTIPEQVQVPESETTAKRSPIPPTGTRTPPPEGYPEPSRELDHFIVPSAVGDIYNIPFGHATTMVGYDMTIEGMPMVFLSEPNDRQMHSFEPNPTILPLLNDGRWLYIDYHGRTVGCVIAALVIKIKDVGTQDIELPEKLLQKNFPDLSQNAVPHWDDFCAPTALGNVAWVLGKKYPDLNPIRIFELDKDATPSLMANMLVGGIKPIPHPDSLAALMTERRTVNNIILGFKKHLTRDDASVWSFIEPKKLLKPDDLLEKLRRELSLGSGIVLLIQWGNPAIDDKKSGGSWVGMWERTRLQKVDENKSVKPNAITLPKSKSYNWAIMVLALTLVIFFGAMLRARLKKN